MLDCEDNVALRSESLEVTHTESLVRDFSTALDTIWPVFGLAFGHTRRFFDGYDRSLAMFLTDFRSNVAQTDEHVDGTSAFVRNAGDDSGGEEERA